MTAIAPFLFWSFLLVAITLAVLGQVFSKLARFIVMRDDTPKERRTAPKTV